MSETTTMKGERTQLVTFRVGEDLFAIDIFAVERVLRYATPRPIPNVPPWLEGVIDYGGRLVPVIDLRARFELPAAASRDAARILVVTCGQDWIGAVVDGVEEVTTVGAAQLEPPPPLFKGLAKEYVRALVRRGREDEPLLVLLDASRLLTARERVVVEQAVAETPVHG